MSVIEILLIVGGVGYVLARRLIGELVELKALLVLPAVLSVIGLFSLRHIAHVDVATIAFIALSVGLSVGLGLLRGRTIHLGDRDGELWFRYRPLSVALWLLNIALKGAAVPVEHAIAPAAADAAGHALLLSLGLGILAESVVVVLRALRTKSVVVWEKGEDGAPHRTLPAFEQARARLESGGLTQLLGSRDW